MERPRPDINEVREAMRQRDDRESQEPPEAEDENGDDQPQEEE